MRLVLGTRGSQLARAQSTLIADLLRGRGHEVRLELITTRGDKETERPVPELGGKGLFTLELEEALREGRIDLAVHSLKDLPTEDAPGLVVAAVPPREDWHDALVSQGRGLMELPAGARVGTASLRRKALLLRCRPDLHVVALRGNVDTRLKRVQEGAVDAIVLAAAGLRRLGRKDAITELLDFLPAPAQGALAIQACGDRMDVVAAVHALHDEGTGRCAHAERELLHVLGGGCSVPVGALCTPEGHHLKLRAVVAATDGSRVVEGEGVGGDPGALGAVVAARLKEEGAQEILDAS
ncbi:MAG: hydroxymethylbilane synthase [Planctomycetes bacterium]|nr:hydroxymethylbilane synthase [Planctomycetota bacterium]